MKQNGIGREIVKGLLYSLLIVVLLGCGLFGLTFCAKNQSPAFKLTDYAKEIKLNTEKYPELESQGLFWWGWNDQTNMPTIEKASTDAGAALIDPKKPTLILVHGWYGTDDYTVMSDFLLQDVSTNDVVLLDDMDAGAEYVPVGKPLYHQLPSLVGLSNYTEDDYSAAGCVLLGKLWLKRGYNFGTFFYNKFSSNPNIINAESAIYFNEDIEFMFQGTEIKKKGTLNDEGDASSYSLAQFFAAEYARAMNKLPKAMGDAEIRIAGHSLGGIMTVVSTRIIAAIADDGQIAQKQVPSRISLMDTYVGFTQSIIPKAWKTRNVAWSGVPLTNGSTSAEYLSYIKYFSERNIAVELYLLQGGAVPALSADGTIKEVMDYAATVIIPTPMFSGLFETWGAGHVSIMNWYLSSITGSVKIEGTDTLGPCATLPTEDLLALKGRIYKINEVTAGTLVYDNIRVSVVDKSAY